MTESNTIKQIRATCENAPTISQDSSFADACKCSKALNEIMEILDLAREAEQEEPERNGDGDTLEDIKAVWKRLKGGSIELQYATGVWRPLTDLYNSDLAELPLCKLRITAKHADRFDPDCMSFETWARAAIGRGIMPSRKTGVGTVTYSCLDDILTDEYMDGEWTAIPRAEAAEEWEPCAKVDADEYRRRKPPLDALPLPSRIALEQRLDRDRHAQAGDERWGDRE